VTAPAAGWPVRDGVLELGDLAVERGGVIAGARLAWSAHGTLNAAGDNAIVYPCSYGADHDELAWLIGPGSVLDPDRYFIVIPDMFSNGRSSSAADTAGFPAVVTMADNVRAQHRLLTGHLGVTRLAAAYGFSMGAGQAYHWAALYPELVQRAIVVCGSARVADNEAELAHLRHGELAVIPSIWGHWAGSPEGIPDDLAFLTGRVHNWLER
jgi:homoserine O-acetyltransferase